MMQRIYGEHQLKVIADPHRHGLPEVVGELLEASGAEQREEVVRARLHRMGFDWFAYATVSQDPRGADHLQFLSSYAHVEWKKRYLAERYHEVDPRWRTTTCDGLPLMWDIQDLQSRVDELGTGPRGHRFAGELCDLGLRSGIYFRLASAQPLDHQAVLSFTSSALHRHWITDDVLAQALVLGMAMHEFMSHHVRRPDPGPLTLCSLRQAILQCLHEGKTNKEIARQTGVSLHAVDYHLRQLRRQFGVRNRTQLVLAARQ
jgi:DNA-binding CsgD family transcriptional regulator